MKYEIDKKRFEEIKGRPLGRGEHENISDGMCVLEATSYIVGDCWSDHPECVCPVISSFLRSWNDGLPDDDARNRLLAPLIPKIINSKSTKEIELKRSYLALDWMVRVMTPAWLKLAGLNEYAESLRDLVELTNVDSCSAATRRIAASVTAARAAALDASRDAASSAASDAASSAARAAASSAARAAALDTALTAVLNAALDAALDAARAATLDAAKAATLATALDALDPTVDLLQNSALELIDKMLLLSESTS